MARYIDTGKAIEKISTITIKGGCTDAYEAGINKGLDIATEIINHTPTADVEPVRHGKWVSNDPDSEFSSIHCSECGTHALLNGCEDYMPSPYCPNCGARMDKED